MFLLKVSPMLMYQKFWISLFLVMAVGQLYCQQVVSEQQSPHAFPITAKGKSTILFVDPKDDSLVRIAAQMLADDIQRVSGKKPLLENKIHVVTNCIIIGTINHSSIIKELVDHKKL